MDEDVIPLKYFIIRYEEINLFIFDLSHGNSRLNFHLFHQRLHLPDIALVALLSALFGGAEHTGELALGL